MRWWWWPVIVGGVVVVEREGSVGVFTDRVDSGGVQTSWELAAGGVATDCVIVASRRSWSGVRQAECVPVIGALVWGEAVVSADSDRCSRCSPD